ncbi:MAG: helix-turn-helix transcriptional regulator [Butyrivibrio sp.]|nr:helix-turn-helix transcriptional regulator [Butyrivibrio sp.]
MEEKSFSSILKELRTSAGYTQRQLANKLGVSKSVVSYYELLERTPSPDTLIRLSGIFQVSTDYLLGLDDSHRVDTSGLTDDDVALVKELVRTLRAKNLARG